MKINIGCGTDIREGWLNVDVAKLPGVDLVCDLNSIPWPLEDASFDEACCLNVLEHVDYPRVLREIHRILRTGARLTISVPHFTSPTAFGDPTHIHYFGLSIFSFFTKHSERPYYYDFAFSEIKQIHLQFPQRKIFFLNYFFEKLVNLNAYTQALYESSVLRIVPASGILVVFVK